MQIQSNYANISSSRNSVQNQNTKANTNASTVKNGGKDEYIVNNGIQSNAKYGTVYLGASNEWLRAEVYAINLELDKTLEGYYEGKSSLDDVKNSVKTAFEALVKLNIDNGNNPDMEALLQRTNYSILERAMIKAVHANDREGESVAKSQGAKHLEWFYYNASYYYMSEDVTTVIKETMSEIADSLNLKDTDIDAFIKEFDPKGMNYNSIWMKYGGGAEFARPNIPSKNVLAMFDVNSKPPADFKIFYSTKCYDENETKQPYNEYFKQTLLIEHLNLKFSAKMSLAEYLTTNIEKKSSFLEFFDYSKDSFEGYEDTHEFLKNFCFSKTNVYNDQKLFDSSMLNYQNYM